MEATIHRTWKPKTAAILNIVAGIGSIGACIAIFVTSPPPPEDAWEIGTLIIAAVILISGILPIIGGTYALQRKKWGLALAGSICAIPGSGLGIPATIFIALAKDEFE